MKKLIISLAIIGLIATLPMFSQKTLAQGTTATIEPTITAADLGVSEPASGFVGWFRNLVYNIQYGLTFNPVKKANMKLDQVNQRLLEAQKFLLENPDKQQAQIQYQQALAKYERTMQKVQTLTERFKDKSATNPKIDQFMNRFTDNVLKQQMIIDKMKNNLTPEKLQLLEKIDENTLKTMGEILKNVDDPARIPDRINNAINNLPGVMAEAKYLKGLEFLNLLDENSRGDLKTVIQSSADRTLTRLQAAWKNQDPEARTERFKEYLNGPGDPILQLKVIDQVMNDPNTPVNLKTIIQAAKTDKVQKIEEAVNAFKNDEHRVRYLERVRQIEDPMTKPLLQGIENRYNNPTAPEDQTRLERAQENVKSDIQQQGTTDSATNSIQEDKDLRDAARNRLNQNSAESAD